MPRTTLAKLTRPRLFGVVPRTRLFSTLDHLRERPLLWVAGPPGAGKTALVAGYCEARDIPGLWYHMDAGDCDAATFFYYLGQAARRINPRAKPLPLMTSEFQSDLNGFARNFFRDLLGRFAPGSALVLDNYHEIDPAEPLHAALQEAFLQAPDHINVIVISRSGPPAAFARSVALNRIGRLGWEDLRLSHEETGQIATVRSAMTDAQIDGLFKRCDGWVAGLTLMLEQLDGRHQRDLAEAQSRETIFDFFASEIFTRISADHQRMLAAAALLPRIRAGALEALSGLPGAAKLLDGLYRRHLFTERRTASPPTYQFHDLFRAFLLSKARSLHSEQSFGSLVQSAAGILDADGLTDDAIDLALEVGDWQTASRLICRVAAGLLAQGRGQRLREWIDAVPDPVRVRSPRLAYWRAMSVLPADPSEALLQLSACADAFARVGDDLGELLACAATIQAIYLEWADCRKFDAWIDRIIALLPRIRQPLHSDDELQIQSALLVACFNRRPGDPLVDDCAARVEVLVNSPGAPNLRVTASMAFLFYCHAAGHCTRGLPQIEKLSGLVESEAVAPLNRMMWWTRASLLLSNDRQMEAARRAVQKAEAGAAELRSSFRSVVVHVPTVAFAVIAREPRLAREAIGRMERARDPRRVMDEAFVHYAQCMVASLTCDSRRIASHALHGADVAARGGMFFSHVGLCIIAAAAHADLGLLDEAAALVRDTRPKLVGTYIEWALSELDLIEAYLLLRAKEAGRARALLERALLAFQTRRLCHLVHTPRLLAHVLAAALSLGIAESKVGDAIVRLGVPPPPDADDRWPFPIRIRLLGSFALDTARGAGGNAKPPYKLLEFLKAVACMGAGGIGTEKVKAMMWPDAEGDAAERSLHTALYRLRKLLGREDALLLHEGRVRLNPEVCWTDLQAFDQQAREFDADQGAATGSLARYTAACFRLYRGTLLEQDPEREWLLGPRERYRAAFQRVVLAIGRGWEELGATQEAVDVYLKAIERDPLAEAFYRCAILCCAKTGDRAMAARLYRRCEQQLSTALGVRPSPTLLSAYSAATRT